MMKTVFVQSSQLKKDKNQREYCDLSLRYSDKGEIRAVNGKIWSNALLPCDTPASGQVLDVECDSEEWPPGSGKKQLNIHDYQTSATPAAEFELPRAVDAESVYKALFCRKWSDKNLQALFDGITHALETRGRGGAIADAAGPFPGAERSLKDILFDIQAGASFHHNRRGGLLQHIEEMVNLANALMEWVHAFDYDPEVLIASILLHDLGKVHEYDASTMAWGASEVGEHVPHTCWLPIWLGAIFGHAALQGKALKVVHCVLSHHGHEGGAPVPPKTPEAILLHRIDQISAELDICREAQIAASRGEKPVFSPMLKTTPICASQ